MSRRVYKRDELKLWAEALQYSIEVDTSIKCNAGGTETLN